MAARLKECLADFGIQGEVQGVQPGPVITMFEFKPAPGVKISRIANLNDDLALALKAMAVRIVAPLPGRDTVGVEIPNVSREIVYLREIMDSPAFTRAKARLPLALGKDIQGNPAVADLARMPHLLVAGATGAGKSVCLNSLLLSMLYKFGPDELKLLLVDPKRIELAVYGDLPHLVHPVVTDMGLAKTALDWAVYEMEQRYDAMARLGVRNIASYNQKLDGLGPERPEDLQDLSRFPYLVIVIDELADLMLTAGKEVEVGIVRLAQLARAAGIHLILATQRPSVDVVTGLIKANFPSRIAFQVSSKHDSRTILDSVGAEYLLGQGDMLHKISGGNLLRLHGAFVDDEEIAGVVRYWKELQPQSFDLDFQDWKGEGEAAESGGDSGGNDVASDPKYGDAVQFVMEQGRASISMIQRRMRIGFNRAARFIEQMEMDGVIGPQEGSKPRTVLKKE
jgi:S-DNA-T family DNA segregation ATPase FtsK/SpoIIIE